jgi:hypothetical protein
MNYLCKECSTELTKFEIKLNEEFPIGNLYCSFCQSRKEREIIKKLAETELEDFENSKIKGSYY